MDNPVTTPPFSKLTPETVLDAVESLGFFSDACIAPLNSYENRVYMVGIEDGPPLIAKFYRPERWINEQIIEEHNFCQELAAMDIPVVAPIVKHGNTLFTHQGYRFALYPRKGGQAPELDNDEHLYSIGQQLGRIHSVGQKHPFEHRPTLTIESFGHQSRQTIIELGFIPFKLRQEYESTSGKLLEKIEKQFLPELIKPIRLHGDCHPGNILMRNDNTQFVDLDDARNGPAIQDLWMLLSGDRNQQQRQLMSIIEGYEMFCSFDNRQIQLIENLRALRLMQYSAWLALRWTDPTFPMHFPWFNTEDYWKEHIKQLADQLQALDEQPLRIAP